MWAAFHLCACALPYPVYVLLEDLYLLHICVSSPHTCNAFLHVYVPTVCIGVRNVLLACVHV